jgi:hypothetical protein
MSAALQYTPEQLEAIIARAAKAGAREALALVSPLPPPPPKRIERKVRVASAKAAEHVARRNRRKPR